jgi:hypothetical protein
VTFLYNGTATHWTASGIFVISEDLGFAAGVSYSPGAEVKSSQRDCAAEAFNASYAFSSLC